jgi:hypothetical protein
MQGKRAIRWLLAKIALTMRLGVMLPSFVWHLRSGVLKPKLAKYLGPEKTWRIFLLVPQLRLGNATFSPNPAPKSLVNWWPRLSSLCCRGGFQNRPCHDIFMFSGEPRAH